MLVMAQLGKMLTDWAGPSSVRRWNVRFTNIAPVLATPTYFAEVQEQTNVDGEPCLRSEEHTSELQSLMRISYAVFCLNKKNQPLTTLIIQQNNTHDSTNTILVHLHKTKN